MINRKGIIGFLFCFVFSLFCLRAEETVHLVQRGETIYSIARSYNVDRDELMRFNGIGDPSKLRAGQHLKIPGSSAGAAAGPTAAPPAAAAPGGSYEARRGDTLYGIARRFGVSLDALLNANSIASSYVLKQGDVLRIPGLVSVAASPQPRPATPAAGTSARAPASAEASPAGVQENRAGDLSLIWPVNARELSYMTGKLPGVAITGERTEAVKSITHGTVISAGPYRGFGRVAIVQVEGGYLYVYGGCETLSVQEGDKVGPGTELGRLGIDTISGKPRLFFMVYRSNTPVDPAKAPRA